MTINRKSLTRWYIAAAAGALTFAAAQAQDVGPGLTPLGAEKAGNAAGTIPAWSGAAPAAPAGFKAGANYPDPFASDKPLFTITGADVEKYKANLTPGQIELFKHYPDYKLIVYPSHRSAAYPKAYNDESAANIGRAKLAENGNGVIGTTAGLPFPTPKNGLEAIWNVETRFLGGAPFHTHQAQAAVTRDGTFTQIEFDVSYLPGYNNLEVKADQRAQNILFYFLQKIEAPARLAGSVLLVHETVDQVKDPRRAWTYNPGQRRVRLAPNVAYDNPGTASDGMRTNDDFQGFNGATDRYDWTLVGKKEIYIPYNSYAISGHDHKVADVVRPGHVNQDLARYELHRVWVVDSKLKAGTSHIYSRRTFYIDEDSWQIVLADKYDARGELYRVGEIHSIVLYDVPQLYAQMELNYDLPSGRYLALGMRNETQAIHVPLKATAADFTPEALRQEGTR